MKNNNKRKKKHYSKYHPARKSYQSSAKTIPANRPGQNDDNKTYNADSAPTRADDLHARFLAAEAAELEEFAEMMGLPSTESENITFTYANVDFPDCDPKVNNRFVVGVLAETNLFNAVTAMHEIAADMEKYADLAKQVDGKHLATELGTYLIRCFCELAKIEEFLADHLVFKLNLIAGYMESENKRDYFANVSNVHRAEFFEVLQPGD